MQYETQVPRHEHAMRTMYVNQTNPKCFSAFKMTGRLKILQNCSFERSLLNGGDRSHTSPPKVCSVHMWGYTMNVRKRINESGCIMHCPFNGDFDCVWRSNIHLQVNSVEERRYVALRSKRRTILLSCGWTHSITGYIYSHLENNFQIFRGCVHKRINVEKMSHIHLLWCNKN